MHHADMLLRRTDVARILESDPRMAGLEQHAEHLAPEREGRDLPVQLEFAAREPAESATMLVPEVPVTVPPPQVDADVVATVSPLGRVSLKAMLLSAVDRFRLVIVKLSVDVAPSSTELGLNDFASTGGEFTCSVAVA